MAFDLEDPGDLASLADPMLTLRPLRGLVVLDEVQRLPGLFPVLRVLADRPRSPARFLVLGSATPELLRQSSESLAGRLSFHDLGGFSLGEVGVDHHNALWLRGGFACGAGPDADWVRVQTDRGACGHAIDEDGAHGSWPTCARFPEDLSSVAQAVQSAGRTMTR